METFILMIELWIEDVGFLGVVIAVWMFAAIIGVGVIMVLNEEKPPIH